MNQVTLCGNVGGDPEVKSLTSGKKVANFSLATSERYKDKTTGETKATTDWHNIVMWEPLSAIAEKHIHKGSKLLITGKLKTRSYESNGQTRYVTEVIAERLELLSEKPSSATVSQTPVMESSGAPKDSSTDDLPF